MEVEEDQVSKGAEDEEVHTSTARRVSRKFSSGLISTQLPEKKDKQTDNEEETDSPPLNEIVDDEEDIVPYAPDGGYGWVILVASFLSNVVLDGVTLSQGVLLVPVLETSNGTITREDYAWVSGTCQGVTLLIGPLVSFLTDTFGFRIVAMSGSFIASFGYFLAWLASPEYPDFWAHIFGVGFLAGIGFGLMFQPSVVIIGLWFNKYRALATGIAVCGTGVGHFIFNPVGQILADWKGWQGAIYVPAAIVLGSIFFGALYQPVPLTRKRDPNTRRSSINLPLAENPNTSLKVQLIPLLMSPTFLILATSGALAMIGFFVPGFFLIDHASEIRIANNTNAAWLVALIGLGNTIGRPIFGFISDKPWGNPLLYSNIALFICGFTQMLVPFLTEYYQVAIFSCIFGVSLACFTALRSIVILEFMGMTKFNNAFGLSLFFMGITSMLGNPMAGALRERSSNYNLSFYVAGAIMMSGGLLCAPLRKVAAWENRKTQCKQTNDQEMTSFDPEKPAHTELLPS